MLYTVTLGSLTATKQNTMLSLVIRKETKQKAGDEILFIENNVNMTVIATVMFPSGLHLLMMEALHVSHLCAFGGLSFSSFFFMTR